MPAHAYCCGPSQPIAHLASGEVGRQKRAWVSPMGSTGTDKKLVGGRVWVLGGARLDQGTSHLLLAHKATDAADVRK